jgi:HSP20 family protein
MALIRWEPARELDSLQTEMNRLFSSFFEPQGQTAGPARRWIPSMDLVETDTHFVLKADLPGMKQDDIAIEFEGDTLTISGERTEQHERKEGGVLRVERGSGAFRRTLTLPQGVDPDAMEATFTDGVLEVRIPKPEEQRPRRVEINVGDKPLIEA